MPYGLTKLSVTFRQFTDCQVTGAFCFQKQMRAFAPALRLLFCADKREAENLGTASTISVAVVTCYNAKTLPRRIFAFVVASHNSHAGIAPGCHF